MRKDMFLLRLITVFLALTIFSNAATALDKVQFERAEREQRENTKYDYVIETKNGPVTVKVRLAVDDATRNRGLMYLRKMPVKEGMLFIYPGEGRRSFWMRNTYIPLDLIFIKRSGEISHVLHNVPPLNEESRPSNGKVLAVLELNGGEAKKLGINVGDKARVPRKWRLKANW